MPIGLVLAAVLVLRLHRLAPQHVARRGRWALALLGVAVLAKAALISQVNPQFRRDDIGGDQIQSLALVWGLGNGLAVLAVAAALVLLSSWRAGIIDTASSTPRLTVSNGTSLPTP